jgi:cytochrome c biogenesis protein CcmG/thiol:disulfide interchange protein DsbE
MRKSLLIPILLAAAACTRHETPRSTSPAREVHTTTIAPAKAPATQTAGETAATTTGVDVGAAMPAYKADLTDGKTFDIASERGNVVFLNLWATWCGPCRFEIPELQAMHEKYASRGLKVVGVSLDDTGVDGVKKFATEHKMTYPIAYDPQGKLADIFQTSVVPTSVIIDRSGKIVWKKFGAVSTSDPSLTDALTKALAATS